MTPDVPGPPGSSSPDDRQRLSFGSVVDAYDRGRPGYPDEAVRWLTGPGQLSVLELGAGTGKLTTSLAAQGHAVLATDPDELMLARLADNVPGVQTQVGSAEQIATESRAFDVVIASQAMHWFDLDRALPEIARVLRPGGVLAMVWNYRDESIPWVRKLGTLIDSASTPGLTDDVDPVAMLAADPHFGFVDQHLVKHRAMVRRDSLIDLVASRSAIAILPEAERAERLARVAELYDGYGRGHDGMQLPYLARCFRSVVQRQEEPVEDLEETQPMNRLDPPEDPGTLLIDFT